MSNRQFPRTDSGDLSLALVAATVAVQAIAAAFFIADAAFDLNAGEWGVHIIAEVLVALALTAGVALGAWQMRRMADQARRDRQALLLARGAVAEIMARRFAEWRLTDAESEVALFTLKGFQTAEIAKLRHVAESTVRAQLTSIYAKAGISSRHALSSLFIEDLVDLPAHGERKTAS